LESTNGGGDGFIRRDDKGSDDKGSDDKGSDDKDSDLVIPGSRTLTP